MESIYVIFACCSIAFSCLCFLLGLIRGEKKFRARLQWIKDAGLAQNVIYEVLGQVNIFYNVFVVVLRNGKNEDFALRMADFELPKTRFVKLGDNRKLVPVCHDDNPVGDSQTPMFMESRQ